MRNQPFPLPVLRTMHHLSSNCRFTRRSSGPLISPRWDSSAVQQGGGGFRVLVPSRSDTGIDKGRWGCGERLPVVVRPPPFALN